MMARASSSTVLLPYMKEAFTLLLEGVSADDIDKAATKFGMPMGPIALMDEVGLDIVAHVIDGYVDAALGERPRRRPIATIKSTKLFGKKLGKASVCTTPRPVVVLVSTPTSPLPSPLRSRS